MRDMTRPLPFLSGTRAVFDLSLEGMLLSRRSILMGLLVGLPVILAVVYRVLLAADVPNRAVPPMDLYAIVVAVYWIRNVLPLMALFHATSLIADEVEGKTLTYLLTRPLTRPSILAGKFAAYLATSLGVALPAAVLTFFILMTARGWSGLGASVPDLFRDLGVVALTLLVYGALFTLLGVLLRRPVIPGLLFLIGWELMANLPGYLPRFTLTRGHVAVHDGEIRTQEGHGKFVSRDPNATVNKALSQWKDLTAPQPVVRTGIPATGV